MARRPRKTGDGLETIARIDARWRKRQDDFWSRVFASRYGAVIQRLMITAVVAVGLFLLLRALVGLSEGVIDGRGGPVRLTESPSLFWARFVWNVALGGLPVALVAVGLWFRFGTARGRRNSAQRRRRAARKLSASE